MGEWITPGVRDARPGNVLEWDILGQRGGVFALDAGSPGPGRGGDSERWLPGAELPFSDGRHRHYEGTLQYRVRPQFTVHFRSITILERAVADTIAG